MEMCSGCRSYKAVKNLEMLDYIMNALSWDEKFDLDLWYVDNQSFWLDLKIILLTVAYLIRPRGISQEGQATMESFRGTSG